MLQSNDVIASAVCPRWAVIGWLLHLAKTATAAGGQNVAAEAVRPQPIFSSAACRGSTA